MPFHNKAEKLAEMQARTRDIIKKPLSALSSVDKTGQIKFRKDLIKKKSRPTVTVSEVNIKPKKKSVPLGTGQIRIGTDKIQKGRTKQQEEIDRILKP